MTSGQDVRRGSILATPEPAWASDRERQNVSFDLEQSNSAGNTVGRVVSRVSHDPTPILKERSPSVSKISVFYYVRGEKTCYMFYYQKVLDRLAFIYINVNYLHLSPVNNVAYPSSASTLLVGEW